MPLSQNALQHIKTKLGSYSSKTKKFPILTDAQIQASLKYTKTMTSSNTTKKKEKRAAAVLVPLCLVHNTPSIIFTVRSSNVSTHKNEICFPGGHFEEDLDNSLVDTAIREMKEEIMNLNDNDDQTKVDLPIQILGETSWVPSLYGTPVTPIVGAWTQDFENEAHLRETFSSLKRNNDNDGEVDLVFSRSIYSLAESERFEPLMRLKKNGPVYDVDIDGGGGKIWGFTAVILHPLLHKVFLPAFDSELKSNISKL